MNTQLLFWYIGVSANGLPVLLGIWASKRLGTVFWAVWGIFIINSLLALLSSGLIDTLYVEGSTLNYLGPIGHSALLAIAFSQVIEHQRLHWFIRLFPVLLALFLGSMVYVRGVEPFFMWGYVTNDSWVLALSVVWFYQQFTGHPDQSARAIPWFWINTMLLFEKLYSLFFALTGQWLYGYHEQLFNVLLYGVSPLITWGNALMACVGIWKQQQLTRRSVGQTVLT